VNSFLKLSLHLSIDGSLLLKSHAFLSFHMLQHMMMMMVMMMMMTTIAKGTPRALLMYQVALSGLSQVGTETPIYNHQPFANGHFRNMRFRCSTFYNGHIS
jgi:hypothetical protein